MIELGSIRPEMFPRRLDGFPPFLFAAACLCVWGLKGSLPEIKRFGSLIWFMTSWSVDTPRLELCCQVQLLVLRSRRLRSMVLGFDQHLWEEILLDTIFNSFELKYRRDSALF